MEIHCAIVRNAFVWISLINDVLPKNKNSQKERLSIQLFQKNCTQKIILLKYPIEKAK